MPQFIRKNILGYPTILEVQHGEIRMSIKAIEAVMTFIYGFSLTQILKMNQRMKTK